MASPQIPSSMRAWQYSQTHGGLEKNLTLNNAAPLPPHDAKALGGDKVLVQVLAMSLNPIDYKFPELPVVGRLAIKKPASPGLDFSGKIVAPPATGHGEGGDPASALEPSTMVFGRLDTPTQFGTLAEFTVARRQVLAVVPEGVSAQDVACVGTAGLTAYQCIAPYVKRGEGSRVFINGGSGGTGSWGIQIAKALGCYVVTSCSGPNAELCKSLGADEVVDYTNEDVVEALRKRAGSTSASTSGNASHQPGPGKFDLIVDNVGSHAALYWHCHEYTTPEATYVQVGAEMSWRTGLDMASKSLWPGFLGGGKRKFHFLGCYGDATQLAEMGQWMREGKIRAVKDEVFRMEDAPKAIERLKTKHARGKVVVVVGE
ncbi:hypothetical protein A1O1_00569 [Capronia coronata CBS 617.96]|uniref:Enoyl reductase (ER) domain-containing protein n=1 Tax=Capronia coronata CBS 617.96 TaxID=1182541 RepID=W9YRE3_9EURO|nr:uncharacterized protein A1O1_00569 [Capronia coronata CBS 617.96]EXJ95447.1 hypothetical protein A1O1_00569 [Capronia coronata CBS 617.96]